MQHDTSPAAHLSTLLEDWGAEPEIDPLFLPHESGGHVMKKRTGASGWEGALCPHQAIKWSLYSDALWDTSQLVFSELDLHKGLEIKAITTTLIPLDANKQIAE